MRRLGGLVAGAMLLGVVAGPSQAAETVDLPSIDWPHIGIVGTYDRGAVQRGYQVYKEVCAGCHGLKYIAFRNLMDIGFSEDEAKAVAADFEVEDGPDNEGEMFMRPAALFDYHPAPFPNDQAARAGNGGALPPDLSLIVKARQGGENYIYGLLIGYREAPADIELGEGLYYNAYFPGRQIAMPFPLDDDMVEYVDGTEATTAQMAKDVTSFLAWAAEPKLEDRHRMGLGVMIFLIILSGLLYAAKRRVWSSLP